jgi:putative isochorismate synthase
VLSRPITVACNVNVAEIFLQMTTLYPSAFVSLIFIPGKELWLGASPETLLSNRNGMVETMSLAGTKCSDDRYSWGDKEQDEQQIVTDSIKVVLSRLSGGQPDISGTFTRNAGKVSHLCTLFRCHISSEDMDTLLQELHPTPAVGGFPKKDAIQLIHETETYDRRYYAGYLGPVLDKNNFDLFVNLRCMEIFSNCVHVYVGGGITKFSQPQLEWTETEIKSRTMLDLIK